MEEDQKEKRRDIGRLQMNFRQTVEEREAMIEAMRMSDRLYRDMTDFIRAAIRNEIRRIRSEHNRHRITVVEREREDREP